MKIKTFALAIAVIASTLVASAQENCGEKCGKNVFVGVRVGHIAVLNDGYNTPAFYGNIEVGRFINPVWGVRAQIAGPWQNLDEHLGSSVMSGDDAYYRTHKLFGELNADAMLNLSQVFVPTEKGYNNFEVIVFAGPQMNVSSVGTQFTGESCADNTLIVENNSKARVRAGASVGVDLNVNVSKYVAISLENRFGFMPSIFGDADLCRKAEATHRISLGAVFTIGGRHGKCKPAPVVVPEPVEKIVEKEVIKEVEKVVTKDVVKEVPGATAVFFPIGQATLSPADKARIQLYADAIKASDCKFTVTGYCDKATGSVNSNEKLSAKRADVVYNALIEAGVPADKLVKGHEGGVDPIFFNNNVLSRTVIMKVK